MVVVVSFLLDRRKTSQSPLEVAGQSVSHPDLQPDFRVYLERLVKSC